MVTQAGVRGLAARRDVAAQLAALGLDAALVIQGALAGREVRNLRQLGRARTGASATLQGCIRGHESRRLVNGARVPPVSPSSRYSSPRLEMGELVQELEEAKLQVALTPEQERVRRLENACVTLDSTPILPYMDTQPSILLPFYHMWTYNPQFDSLNGGWRTR